MQNIKGTGFIGFITVDSYLALNKLVGMSNPELHMSCSTAPVQSSLPSKYLDTQSFNLAVYQIVRAIPRGKLITCRHIAKLIGFPSQARRVREAVNFIAHTTPPVAWHRVIPTSGVISVHGPNAQQRLLEAEGIEVNIGVVGESRVDVEKWGWFPEGNDVCFHVQTALEDDQDWGA